MMNQYCKVYIFKFKIQRNCIDPVTRVPVYQNVLPVLELSQPSRKAISVALETPVMVIAQRENPA